MYERCRASQFLGQVTLYTEILIKTGSLDLCVREAGKKSKYKTCQCRHADHGPAERSRLDHCCTESRAVSTGGGCIVMQ